MTTKITVSLPDEQVRAAKRAVMSWRSADSPMIMKDPTPHSGSDPS